MIEGEDYAESMECEEAVCACCHKTASQCECGDMYDEYID